MRVVSTNKTPFTLRQQLSRTIGVPEDQIVVDSATIGGDFGGKGTSFDEYICFFLARATGRPSKPRCATSTSWRRATRATRR